MSNDAENKFADNLNYLLEYLHDSMNGYLECEKVIADASLKIIFKNLSIERQKMIEKLKSYVKAQNQSETKSGTVMGALHRFYVDLKAMIASSSKESIVAEINRGENLLISKYDDVLRDNQALLPEVKILLEQQRQEVVNSLNYINKITKSTESARS
jgi:uncharacterized protein (TIGR02284 family)